MRRWLIPLLVCLPSVAAAGPSSEEQSWLRPRLGALLGVVEGPSASYRLHGDELYVRAKIISSKKKLNGFGLNEMEVAWTQPLCAGD